MKSEQKRQIMICRIIKSLATNYPILLDTGYGFEKLLVLVVRPGEMGIIMKALSDNNPLMIQESMVKGQAITSLLAENSKPVFYPYTPSAKRRELLEVLKLLMKTGIVENQNVSAMPILISEGIPPDIDLSDCFSIYFNGGLRGIVIQSREVVPADDQVPVVLDKIKDFAENAQTQEEKSLKAAACFLYPILKDGNAEKDLSEYLDLVAELTISDDENQDTNNLGENFLRELYRWQEASEFSNVYELPNLGMEATKDLEHVMFYDEQFIYIKDALFKEILGTLLKIFSVDALKNSLVQEKILCPSQAKSYTVKVGYYNVAGEFCRIRMLRFDRNRLRMAGELDFIELCIDRRKD